ncbi:MAG: hypothetical protein IH586_13155 [Anaerolineaceae bacterium]|nr:hypothetical protein [Anaerolineaceae bacterium]
MLVTSRHRLLLQAEHVMEVSGLEFPQTSAPMEDGIPIPTIQAFSAVELFLQAAQRTRVTFQGSAEDLSAIVQITRLLEGNPLGLELAATWTNTLSCQEIASEISRGLDILETSLGDISERQRSMRAVFDHSWNLLSSREQAILPRLAVFRGSFTRQAAEQVAGISLRELSGLVDKSLVRRASNGRFDMHDLLRQYCAEILDQFPSNDQETRNRHCAFYSGSLTDWSKQIHSAKQGEALREIEADLENIQAAWEWSVRHKKFDCLEQAVDGLGMYYLRRARLSEGWDAYQEASEVFQECSLSEGEIQIARLSLRILTWQATLSLNLERFEEAGRLLQAVQLIQNNPKLDQQQIIPERIFGLVIQALLANLQYDPAATLLFYREAYQLSRTAKMKSPSFFIFFWRFMMGGSPSPDIYLEVEKNLGYVEQSGDPFELGCHLYILGIAELYHAYRVDKAEPLLRESIKNFQLVDDLATQVMLFKTLGYLLLVQGKFDECLALKQREMTVVENIGDCRLIGITHAEIGEVLCHLGKYPEAEDQIRIGLALVKDRSEMEYALRHRYLGDVLLAQDKCAEALEAYLFSYHFFQSVGEKGWMLTALTGLSRAEFALGSRSSAWHHAKQALTLYTEIHLYTFFVFLTLADIALLLADRGEIFQARELYRLASKQDYLAQSSWFADLYGKFIDETCPRQLAEEEEPEIETSQELDLPGTIARILLWP